MPVNIHITDDQVQIIKRNSNGTTSEELTWQAVEQGPKGDPGESAPESTRITIALTSPYATAGSPAVTADVYSAIYWIPPDVTSVNVQIGYRQIFTPDGYATNVSSMKIAGGEPSADRQSFVGSPTVHTGITVPAFMLSEKVTIPVARDADGYMMFRWTVPSGSSFLEYTTNAGQDGYVKKIANSADVEASVGWSNATQPAGHVLIEYNTEAPKLVIWNDSIQRGLADPGECGLLNTLVRMGPERGYAVSVTGCGFAAASTWANLTNWMLGDTSPVKDATVLIAVGTNDLFASVSSVNIILYLRRMVLNARAMGAKRVILATIISSSGYSSPQNDTRIAVNAWIRAQIGWVDDVLDMDEVVGPTGTNPSWFATGNVHLKTIAFTAIEAIFPTLE